MGKFAAALSTSERTLRITVAALMRARRESDVVRRGPADHSVEQDSMARTAVFGPGGPSAGPRQPRH